MREASTTPNITSLNALKENLNKIILGKKEQIDLLIIALLANGSILLEDVPGVGKTTLAKAAAQSISAIFRRVQFTPDLLPADIIGASIYNPVSGDFKFHKGPIFCNILLADEINRASPRTQSALLEAMSEKQVSVDGESILLQSPFLVLATQNPVEFQGTYPLPEAQLDRFMMQINLGYPEESSEVGILQSRLHGDPLLEIKTRITCQEIQEIQAQVKCVEMDESISQYIIQLCNATRNDSRTKLGASPRGALMLACAAQARAFMQERTYTLPDDIQALAQVVLSHRIILHSKSRFSGVLKSDVIEDAIHNTKVPI